MSASSRQLACIVLMLFCAHVQAAIKGSESSVSIESAYTFPAIDTNNKITGFAWFKNGFSLEDQTTTCTFDSVYPVSGVVDLAGGKLHLQQDLVFKNNTQLAGFGSVIGNGYSLDLCSSITHIPSNAHIFKDVTLFIHNDLKLDGAIIFQGKCSVIGESNTLNLASHGACIIAEGASLALRNITLTGVQAGNIRCVSNTGALLLDAVRWQLDDNYTFSLGSIAIVDTVDVVGTATFSYSSVMTSTITENSRLRISEGVHLSIGKVSEQGSQPIYFDNSSSQLVFDSSSLEVGEHGIQLTRGKVIFNRDVAIDILGTDTTSGVIVGNNNISEDLVLQYNSGSSVTLKSGYFVYNNASMDAIKATSKSAKLARTINSRVYLAQSVVLPEMTVEVLSNYTPPMEIASGKTLTYDGTAIILPNAAFDVRSDRYDLMTFYLNGADSLFLTKGVFPLNVLVTNNLNRLQGNGSIISDIILQNSSAQLIANFQGLVNKDIVMNGGTITLENDFVFGALASFDGIGTIDLDKFSVVLGNRDAVWTGTTAWHGSDGSISLNAQLSLTSTCTFYGDITIHGNGNELDLGTTGKIVVADGARLTLHNLLLDHVHGSNISCLGDQSSIVLNDVVWVQDADFTLAKGSLEIVNQVDFTGGRVFTYDSSRTSTIAAHSEWHFKDQMKAVLGKHSNGSQPIWFEDASAVWHFSHADIQVTNGGLQLTHGTLYFDHEILVDIDSTSTANGVIFGGGSVENDFVVQYNAGATVHARTGHITFNNITLPSVVPTAHKGARLIRGNGSNMYFAQNMTLPSMTVELESNSVPPVVIASGKTVSYSDVGVVTPHVEFDLTGQLINYYSYGLFGGKSMFLSKGILPLYTIAAGPGNILHGTGSITGQIILSGPTTSLYYGVNGYLGNNVVLNGGSVSLLSNMDLSGSASIVGPGVFNLGSLSVHLGQNHIEVSSPVHWIGNNAAIELNAQLSLSSTWTIDGNINIDGKRNLMAFEPGGKLYVTSGSTLELKCITLHGVKDTNIVCEDDTATIVLDDVEWIQTGDYAFSYGALLIENEVTCRGAYNFVYDSSCTSTIDGYSAWRIADQMTLQIGRQQLNSAEPLYFVDSTSVLNFNNANYAVSSNGMHLTRGKMVFDHEVLVDIAGTDTTHGVVLGSGIQADDFMLQFNAGSTAKHTHGYITLRNNSPYTFKSVASTGGCLYRGNQAHLYVDQNIISPPLTIKLESSSVPAIVMANGISVMYDRVVISLPDVEYELQGSVVNYYMNMLAYGQSATLTKGILPVYLLAVGPGNIVRGNGSIAGMVILADSSSQITYALNGAMLNNIVLNGGILTLANSLSMGRGCQIIGPGHVNLGSTNFKLGSQDLVCATPLCWGGSNAKLEMSSQVSLVSTWTFANSCVVQGNGNTLDLGQSGHIYVAPGAHVEFKNIKLKNVHDHNILCADNTASLTLTDVTWEQDDKYIFDQGSLLISGLSVMRGDASFVYQSARTSTVAARSSLLLDEGFTFSYDPIFTPSQELLAFVDNTSRLILNGATLHATCTGMQLAKGKLIAQLDAVLESETLMLGEHVLIDHGITFGTGFSGNNMAIDIAGGANLILSHGSLNYNNTTLNSFYMRGPTTRFTIKNDTRCNVLQDIDLGDGVMYLSSKGILDVAESKNLEGSVYIMQS